MVKHQFPSKTMYSDKYADEEHEYRHVTLCQEQYERLPIRYRQFYEKHQMKESASGYIDEMQLLSDAECKQAGVTQSNGWEHYLVFQAEPFVLLFRRLHGTDPVTGFR